MSVTSEVLNSSSTSRTYSVSFDGDNITTTVTHNSSVVHYWIEEILTVHRRRLHKLIVGLDVEWRPNFYRGQNNPAAVLQLCVGRRCLVFQLIYAHEIPQSLYDFLAEESYTFVGVGIDGDVEKIKREYDLEVSNVADLRKLAAERLDKKGLRQAGLKVLANEVLGKEVEKPKKVTRSTWDRKRLSDDQVQYACLDAFLSFEMGRVLKSITSGSSEN